MGRPTAITIGNFDGVHLGHQLLVRCARRAVHEDGRVIAVTFDPHPSSLLESAPVDRLSTVAQRAEWLNAAGADEVVAIQTTALLLQLSPQEFMAKYIEPYAPTAIIEGADFRFGHRRAGTIETLREFGTRSGVEIVIVDEVEASLSDQSKVRVSSSLVRWLLERGRVRDAGLLLGRPYELRGNIVSGDQRGRHIGFPTMNLDHGDFLLPADGIYAGHACMPDGRTFAAAISVGTKPTFGCSPRVCEAHLLEYHGALDDYGFPLQLQITHWLRDQLKYDTVAELIPQLHRDVASVRELCSHRQTAPASTRPHAIGCAAT